MNGRKTNLPSRTVERFFLYSRFLKAKRERGAEYVCSHELSLAVGISPEQVRQDMRRLNVRGTPQKGYLIDAFLADLNECLGSAVTAKAVLIGAGNLGRALLSHFTLAWPSLKIIAAFDRDRKLAGSVIASCRIYNMTQLASVLKKEKPLVGIIAVPPDDAQQIADELAAGGVKGLLNFAPAAIKPARGVYLEQIDLLMALEKTAFFARNI